MQELQVRFEPPDVMGLPPDPLPIPLFSSSIASSGACLCVCVYAISTSVCRESVYILLKRERECVCAYIKERESVCVG